MGQDDDEDCPGHVWVVIGIRATSKGAQQEHECERCGAVTLDPGHATRRPPLA